jgi:hypothetical protein
VIASPLGHDNVRSALEYIPICDLCEYANVLSGSADIFGPVELAPILKHAAIHMNKTINNGLSTNSLGCMSCSLTMVHPDGGNRVITEPALLPLS